MARAMCFPEKYHLKITIIIIIIIIIGHANWKQAQRTAPTWQHSHVGYHVQIGLSLYA